MENPSIAVFCKPWPGYTAPFKLEMIMRDFSTQAARPDVEREELEFDVLFVGAGPSNLAG